MRFLRNLALALLSLVAAFLLIALFLPSHYHVWRGVVIQAAPEAVFPYLNNLKKWEQWSAWTKAKDPTLVYSYSGPEEGTNAVSQWEGKKLGQGSLTITESVSGKSVQRPSVKYDLSFDRGKKLCTSSITLEAEAGGTRVIWAMDGETGRNPIHRYFALMMDRMVGPDFEEGLRNLKRVVEGK